MLYTVGHAESYEEGLDTQKHLMKKGKRKDYPGGIVFLTREDAERYLEKSKKDKAGFKPYGLRTNYENTEPWDDDEDWPFGIPTRRLILDCQIVRLDR